MSHGLQYKYIGVALGDLTYILQFVLLAYAWVCTSGLAVRVLHLLVLLVCELLLNRLRQSLAVKFQRITQSAAEVGKSLAKVWQMGCLNVCSGPKM